MQNNSEEVKNPKSVTEVETSPKPCTSSAEQYLDYKETEEKHEEMQKANKKHNIEENMQNNSEEVKNQKSVTEVETSPKPCTSSAEGHLDYKETGEMYEEMEKQSKLLNNLRKQHRLLKTKISKQDTQLAKKDKEIEELTSRFQNQMLTRCIPKRKHKCCEIVVQQTTEISSLEENCTDMGLSITSMQMDFVQLEADLNECLDEDQNLQALLRINRKKCRKKIKPAKDRMMSKRERKLKTMLSQLKKKKTIVQEEVRCLESEVKEAQHNIFSNTEEYVDWSREQLISLIKDLERKEEEWAKPQISDDSPDSKEDCKNLQEEDDKPDVQEKASSSVPQRLNSDKRRMASPGISSRAIFNFFLMIFLFFFTVLETAILKFPAAEIRRTLRFMIGLFFLIFTYMVCRT